MSFLIGIYTSIILAAKKIIHKKWFLLIPPGFVFKSRTCIITREYPNQLQSALYMGDLVTKHSKVTRGREQQQQNFKISTFFLEEDSFQSQCFTSCKPAETVVREQVCLQMSLELCNENLQWYFFSSPRTRSFFSSSVQQSKPRRKPNIGLKVCEIVNSQLLQNKLKK